MNESNKPLAPFDVSGFLFNSDFGTLELHSKSLEELITKRNALNDLFQEV